MHLSLIASQSPEGFFCRDGLREEQSDEAICLRVQFASAILSDVTQCISLLLPRKVLKAFFAAGVIAYAIVEVIFLLLIQPLYSYTLSPGADQLKSIFFQKKFLSFKMTKTDLYENGHTFSEYRCHHHCPWILSEL